MFNLSSVSLLRFLRPSCILPVCLWWSQHVELTQVLKREVWITQRLRMGFSPTIEFSLSLYSSILSHLSSSRKIQAIAFEMLYVCWEERPNTFHPELVSRGFSWRSVMISGITLGYNLPFLTKSRVSGFYTLPSSSLSFLLSSLSGTRPNQK